MVCKCGLRFRIGICKKMLEFVKMYFEFVKSYSYNPEKERYLKFCSLHPNRFLFLFLLPNKFDNDGRGINK